MKDSSKEVVCFRTSQAVKQLFELVSKKNGQSKSEFLEAVILDTSMDFEKVRTIDTLTDFLDVSLPFLTQGMEEKEASKLKQRMANLQAGYIKDRLRPNMRIQKHLTNIAVRSYLQDYVEEFDGMDGFIINQCLQSIYDVLASYGIITREEWEEKNQSYTLYMQKQNLMQQEEAT